MRVTATCSFGGEISMTKGETREIPDGEALRSLMRAGYIENAKPQDGDAPKPAAKKKSSAKKATP